MLDPEATIARAILLLDALVDVELCPDRLVTDGMHYDLQTGFVGARRPLIQVLRRVDEKTCIVRRIGERLKHRGGVRAQGAVDKAFEAADVKPLVAAALRGHCGGELLP